MKKTIALLTIPFVSWLVASGNAQDTKRADDMQNCPLLAQHTAGDSHHAAVEKHGEQAMGFPQDKTTHHFRMALDGGTIEVTANDPKDAADSEAIRIHLSHIATVFAMGDFSTPMFVHDSVPPGVTSMKLLKAVIRYRYEEVPAGGRVRIESADPVAVAAVHDFLRFQMTEHQTGDSLEVVAH